MLLTYRKHCAILCKVFCFTLKITLIGRVFMFEKDLNISYLLDFYGELLSEKKRTVMDMYFNEDLSLAEIAEQIGISRQGVRDIIKKSEEDLYFYEEKLGLAKKLQAVESAVTDLYNKAIMQNAPEETQKQIAELAELVKQ